MPSTPILVADPSSLDRGLFRSIAWTGGMKWATQLLSWISTLIVARLLTPEDYGLVSMAAVYLGLVTLINDFGFGSAIVMLRDLSNEQVAQINLSSVLLGFAAFGVSCLLAVPLGRFFGAPDLPGVIVAMSAAFVITAFRTVPQALLEKEMQFKLLAFFDGSQSLVLAVSTVILALLGLGYWTLVMAALLSATFSTGLVLAWRTHRFSWPDCLALKSVLTFSSHIIASRLSWYVYSNADFLVAGRVLGQTVLGHYSFSWSLAAVPVEKVTALVGRVTPAFLAAVQSDRAALRRYLLILTEGLALVTFPATFGLALVADDFVILALGDKWAPVIFPLRLLACYASFRAITPLLPQVLFVSGQSRFGMWNGIVAAILLPIGFYAGSSWGSTGIAATWLLLHPLVTLPLYWRVFRTIDLSLLKYLQSLWPAVSGSLLMIIGILLVRSAVDDTWSLSIRFAVQVLTGGTVYISVMFLAYRDRLVSFYQIVKSVNAS